MPAKKLATAARKTTAKSTASRSSQKKQTAPANMDGQEQDNLLYKLFVDMLKDMLWAEKHLVTQLNTMQTVATTSQLQEAFEDHKFATQKHVSRLEKVFKLLGVEPEVKKCDAMEGLTNEANSMIQETKEGTMTRDAALIIAAQKVEHYEIASYGSLVQVARTLGNEEAASILEKTLWEEEDTDQLLTDIAESDINPLADDEQEEDMEETEEEEEEEMA
ncbi:MAG: YciE/YciF ferroxidase family protein [Flavipsychrobacter sp.]